MVYTEKFSEFPAGTLDQAVGLAGDVNTRGPQGGGGGGSVTEIITQDTSALTVGRWVRFDQGTNLYVHGLADTPQDAEIAGVVLNIISSSQFTLQQSGYIPSGTPGFNGFTAGIYFLSDTMAGQQVLTIPTINGHINKPVFDADSADSGWVICLSRGAIIGSPGPIPSGGGGSDSNIHTVDQPGNGFSIGKWVRVIGDNEYGLADGTNLSHAQSVGVVIASGNPNFTIQFSGWNSSAVTMAVDSVGNPIALVASTVYYLSDVSPGNISPTPPAILSEASKPVFISESVINGTGWILPQRPLPNEIGGNNPIITPVYQPGHGFTTGQVVRVSAANTYALAQGDSLIDAIPVGFVQVIDANNFILQQIGYCGFFTPPFSPLLPSARYFLSPTVAGGITTTEPTTVGQYSVPVLVALNSTTGYILSQRPLGAVIDVTEGGTGDGSFTPNSVIGSGTTSTSPLISIGPGAIGTVLTGNGPSLPPTFQSVGLGNVFLGYLNDGNNFQSTNILLDVSGNSFGAYQLIINAGGGFNLFGIQGKNAGAGLVGIGFQLYMNGAWLTALGSYAAITGGVEGNTATPGTTSFWSTFPFGVVTGTDNMLILPRTSNNVGLNSGNAILTNNINDKALDYAFVCVDYSAFPPNQTDYTSSGVATCTTSGVMTGLRVYFDNGTYTPGSTARIAVYGIPNA